MKKFTIENMQEIAGGRGGKCLSDTYVNPRTKLLWECAEGHQWEAVPMHVRRSSWCPHCAGLAKGTIEEMQSLAEQRGGKCLSDVYVGSLTKHIWQCSEGHKWEAVPHSIKNGSWCPTCFINRRDASRRLRFKTMQEIARQRGGECLSKSYKNAKSPLKWKCAKGHVWEASADYVKNQGYWCGICAKEE